MQMTSPELLKIAVNEFNNKQLVAGLEKFSFGLVEDPETEAGFESLLSESFKVPAGQSFYDDFPVWQSTYDTYKLRVVAKDESGRVIAGGGVRITDIHAPSGALPVAIIGAICTAQNFRGKGFGSRIVQFLIQWAETRKVAGIFLWGSEINLYGRLGFSACGRQYKILAKDLVFRADSGSSVSVSSEVRLGFNHSIFELMRRRSTGIVLRSRDEKWLGAHQNTEWVSLWSKSQCLAYLAIGRGIDLHETIHEWGGTSDSLQKLLQHAVALRPNLIMIGGVEEFETSFPIVKGCAKEIQFLAKICDPAKWLSGYRKGIEFVHDREDLRSLEVQWFGEGERTGGTKFEPLPIWFWGLDGA